MANLDRVGHQTSGLNLVTHMSDLGIVRMDYVVAEINPRRIAVTRAWARLAAPSLS